MSKNILVRIALCVASLAAGPSIVHAARIYRLVNYPELQNGHTLSGTITTTDDAPDDSILDVGEILDWEWIISGPNSLSAASREPDEGEFVSLQVEQIRISISSIEFALTDTAVLRMRERTFSGRGSAPTLLWFYSFADGSGVGQPTYTAGVASDVFIPVWSHDIAGTAMTTWTVATAVPEPSTLSLTILLLAIFALDVVTIHCGNKQSPNQVIRNKHMFTRLLRLAGFNGRKGTRLCRFLRFEQFEDRRMLSVVPAFSSNPGSGNSIFLDFDGHNVADSHWTNPTQITVGNNGQPIHAPIYNIPGGDDYEFDEVEEEWVPIDYSQEELGYIEMAWELIAEDFAPFDVDVTTVEPDPSFFTTGGPNGERAIRILFTSRLDDGRLNGTANAGNDWLGQSNNWIGSDLISGIGAFDAWTVHNVDRPVWVFANQFDTVTGPGSPWVHPDTGAQGGDPDEWGPEQEYMGTIGSHELGHGFGLEHDSVDLSQAVAGYLGDWQYYGGHTSGPTDAPTSWGAIMGGSELRTLTQWSKGEYLVGQRHFEKS